MKMILRALTILALISCCSSLKKNHTLDREKIIELLNLLEIDPRPELSIYIINGESLNSNATLLTVRQSRSKGGDIQSSFKYKGHDVFLYDSLKHKEERLGRSKIFFDTDSPSWKVMVLSSSDHTQYFLMESLAPSANDTDTTRVWNLD